MKVLVTGGAGYIGSVVVEELLAAPDIERVIVLDNLSTGHRTAVPVGVAFVAADIADTMTVTELLRTEQVDAVIHLAASALVGESIQTPARYYANNVLAGLKFLEAAIATRVERFVFSSSAAVYGDTGSRFVAETDDTRPCNPYGETKLAFERALEWYGPAYGIKHASLRYFNAAGATCCNGEDRDPETHLIPNILRAVEANKPVRIFGDDFQTADGTCVRDYVHVHDLARAHVTALRALRNKSLGAINLGGGRGHSIRDVLRAAEHVLRTPIATEIMPRRRGDPAVLVADTRRAQQILDWPSVHSLDRMIRDVRDWRREHPRGYAP